MSKSAQQDKYNKHRRPDLYTMLADDDDVAGNAGKDGDHQVKAHDDDDHDDYQRKARKREEKKLRKEEKKLRKKERKEKKKKRSRSEQDDHDNSSSSASSSSSSSDSEDHKKKSKKHKKKKHRKSKSKHNDDDNEEAARSSVNNKQQEAVVQQQAQAAAAAALQQKQQEQDAAAAALAKLQARNFKTAKAVIKKLLKLYPDADSEMRQLFQIIDEQEEENNDNDNENNKNDNNDDDDDSLDITQLEDKRVSYLLSLLFDKFWVDHVTRTSKGSYKKKKQVQVQQQQQQQQQADSAQSSPSSLLQLYDTIVEQIETERHNKKHGSDKDNGPQPVHQRIGGIGPAMPPTATSNKPLNAQERARDFVKRYNAIHRPKSLLEQHRDRLKSGGTVPQSTFEYKGASSEYGSAHQDLDQETQQKLASKGYMTWSRDKDLNAPRQMAKPKVDELIKRSSELNDRFGSSGIQTSFLWQHNDKLWINTMQCTIKLFNADNKSTKNYNVGLYYYCD